VTPAVAIINDGYRRTQAVAATIVLGSIMGESR